MGAGSLGIWRNKPVKRLGELLAAVVILFWLAGQPAWGLIDPSFTPMHLVKDAERIVAGKLAADKEPDRWTLAEPQTLKGRKGEQIRLSLAILNAKDAQAASRCLQAAVGSTVVLFQGNDSAYVLVNNIWLELKSAGGDDFQIKGYDDQRLSKAYGGAADKLLEMTEYILHDKDADVPVAVGVKWDKHVPVGSLSGASNGMVALTAKKGSGARLLVACAGGDRLFAYDKTKGRFEDQSKRMGLDTASRALAMVDLDRDGLPDLASWDGSRLTVRLGRPDGGFSSSPKLKDYPCPAECSALAAISPSQDGAPGLLVCSAWPQVLAWTEAGWHAQGLPGEKAHKPDETAADCVPADWDGDGYVDVIQIRQQDSLYWKGKRGGFGEPRKCAVKSGGGPVRWCAGDFGTAGRLDLLVCGRKLNELWQDSGDGDFRPVIRYAGSLDRMEAGAADCLTADLNHDGRQDVTVLTGAGHLVYHFNRGYRLLADEGDLRLESPSSDTKPAKAVRAVAGDFNGDGSLDLAVAYSTGEVDCYFNGQFTGAAQVPGLWIGLPSGHTGPVTVSVWQGQAFPVCVGTYLVQGHAPATYVSLRKGEPCTIKWRWPGGPLRDMAAKAGADVVLPIKKEGNDPS